MRLRHAHHRLAHPELLDALEILLRLHLQVDPGGAVEPGGDRLDLFDNRRLVGRDEGEIARLAARRDHRVGQLDGAGASLREPLVNDHGFRPRPDRQLLEQRPLLVGVGRKAVDGDDTRQPVLAHDLDVRGEIVHARPQRLQILLAQVGERFAAVRLRRPDGGDEHRGAGGEAARAANDVAELLHPEVTGEAGLGNDVIGQLQGDAIGEDRVVAVRDVAERPGVDQHRLALERLHDVGIDCLLHDHRHRPGDLQIIGGDRFAVDRRGHDDAPQPPAQVLEIAGQREHRHHFRGGRDHELVLPRDALDPHLF